MTLCKLKCLECGFEWEEPQTKSWYVEGTMCTDPLPVCQCGSKYMKWVNFEEMKENNFK